MGGSGEVPGLAPPIRDPLNPKDDRAPNNEDPDCGDISNHRREHGKPPLVACWLLVVEFAGRFALRAIRAACSETMRWTAR